MKRYDFFTGGKNNILVDKWMNMVNFKLDNEIEKLTDQHGQEHGTSEESNPWPPEHRALYQLSYENSWSGKVSMSSLFTFHYQA